MTPKTVEVPPLLEAAFEARELLPLLALVRDGRWHPVDAGDDDPGEGSGRYCVPADDPLVVLFTNWRDGLPVSHGTGAGTGARGRSPRKKWRPCKRRRTKSGPNDKLRPRKPSARSGSARPLRPRSTCT